MIGVFDGRHNSRHRRHSIGRTKNKQQTYTSTQVDKMISDYLFVKT